VPIHTLSGRFTLQAAALLLVLAGIAQYAWAAAPATTTTLTVTSRGAEVTSVAAGSVVTLTAIVNAGSSPVTMGQVSFCDAAATYCTDIHLLGTAQLTSAGTARLRFVPGAGSHSYKAVFAGTLSAASSASGTSVLLVAMTAKYPTTTRLGQSVSDGKYTLTATVKGTGGPVPPTGAVSFFETSDHDKLLGTAELGTGTKELVFPRSAIPETGKDSSYPVVIGDFNGDGVPDLAVANQASGTVTILLGNGNGQFSEARESPVTVGSKPVAMAVGDFNGDGTADLVVVSAGTETASSNGFGTVTILLGNGDGTFSAAAKFSAGMIPASVAVGDFTGDGIPDLVIAGALNPASDQAGIVTVLIGTGDGSFSESPGLPLTVGSEPAFVATGDFTGDGVLDLAVANAGSGTVTILLGDGHGNFRPTAGSPVQVGSGPNSIAAVDFNGDGKLDLAVANSVSGTVTVLLGNGDGMFTQAVNSPVQVGSDPSSLALGDFNQDGVPDLAVTNTGSNTVTVLVGNGDGTFTQAPNGGVPVGRKPSSVAVGDFTRDGIPDLAIGNDASEVNVLLAQLTQTADAMIEDISLNGPGPHKIEAKYAGDSNDDSSVSGILSITAAAETPVLTPGTGAYATVKTVTITDATPGATIHYALHGRTPTTSSKEYKGPIKVSSTESIKAIATATGYTTSAVASAIYTIDLPVTATPTFSPPAGRFTAVQIVKIEDATPGASIYYTTDGDIPTTASTLYTGPIRVATTLNLRAIAVAPDYTQSEVARANYVVTLTTATPVIAPPGGPYFTPQAVTIKDATRGAAIYYTTNGKRPTTSSTLYTGAIPLTYSADIQILKAMAVAPGYQESAIVSAAYTITPLVATPTFSPPAGTYSSATTVTISDSTENTAIYYTTDGKIPTSASTLYKAPIDVTANETIQAIAVAPGNQQSLVASATYTITLGTAAPPVLSSTPALNGAVLVSLTSSTYAATVYYTLNGSTPSTSSQIFQAPFLVASNLTVKAIAAAPALANSPVTTQTFAPGIPSGTLVWSDEFNNSTGANLAPNPQVWTYDTGNSGFGNQELENYCSWGSAASPCSLSSPNAYVGTDGYLHIVARQPSAGVYTSARLKTESLFSFQYGRLEVRARVPEAQGFWPAAWLMGNNIATVSWPDCGEQDVLERVDAAGSPDWNEGSVHGPNFTGGALGTTYYFPSGQTAAGWHTYGMIWSKGSVAYYVDDPTQPYVTYTPSSLRTSATPGAAWPFDRGQANFILLNLAVGGDWPGPPNSTTPFPAEYLVDYVRLYTT
jgi:beta-glucanase (GH16 family)